MNIKKTIVLAVLLMAIFPFCLFGQSFEEMWKKFDEANNKGLPKTAIKELEPIYEKAIKENEPAQAIKALTKKITLEGVIQGNLPEERIIRFEKAVESADKTVQPMLKVILAKWYFNYYTRNRYRFIRRSSTSEDTDLKDFKTWDLPKLFAHIGKLYDSVIEKDDELSKIPISKFDGFLEAGNQPTELVSNLFEFFVQDALSFYNHEDQSTAKPRNAFEIDADSNVFGSIDEFISWNPETVDKTSSNYKALKLYQKLISLNKATNNINALINNNINRINWANKVAVGPDKKERYLSALKSLISQFPDNQYSATALYLIAEHYENNGDFVNAVEYCERAIQKWPSSYGALKAQNLLKDIKSQSISYDSEKIITSDNNSIKISFKNLNHAYFRLIKRSENEILKCKYRNPDTYNRYEVNQLLSKAPDYAFDTELDPEKDYKVHNKTISFPQIDKGYYWLICSANKEFTESNNAIHIAALQVSDLAFITRSGKVNGNNQIFVVDSISGNPINNAQVKIYQYYYKDDCYKLSKTNKTNKDGIIEINSINEEALLICNHNSDKIYKTVSLYSNEHREEVLHDNVYIFTDRAIYRPGQTVYFKAISIRYNKATNDYYVCKDKNLEISFRDPNRKVVKELSLVTNKYGSVTGSFIAPTDRLTGEYLITCDLGTSARIKVEEYKRPKFKVTINAPEEGYQLGQNVKLKGNALAYTGANIDNAEVKYRVTRLVRYPYWCWWIPRNNNSQEICHGITKTDEKGEFIINFIAKPDRSIDKSLDPVFEYSITADVTDNTGETRSASDEVSIGYTAMELHIGASRKFNADKDYKLSVNSTTHDGVGIPSEGKVTVYQLEQPEKPVRHAYSVSEITNDESAIRSMKEGKVVFEERYTSDKEGKFSKTIKLPEGIYRIRATSEDRFGKEVKAETNTIAISYSSSKNTIKLPFIYEELSQSLKPGDTYEAFWSTGYNEGPAYIEIYHRNKLLKSYWTDAKSNKSFIKFPVSDAMRGGFVVKILQVKENRFYQTSNNVYVPWSNKDLKLKLVHFTSKMEPGSNESWKIEVSGEDAEMDSIEMLASMYDASLDAYARHYWPGISVFYTDYCYINQYFSNEKNYINNWRIDFPKGYIHVPRIEYPKIPQDVVAGYYGYDYMMTNRAFGVKAMSAPRLSMKSAGAVNMLQRSVQEDSADYCSDSEGMGVVEECAVMNSAPSAVSKEASLSTNESEEKEEVDLSKVTARSNLNETAFFMPQLTFNKDGIVTIDFQMPESLTTWKFMGFAHGTKLQSGSISQEVITQKELMIQPNAPRFLREGDKIAFTVKVTNLSDQEQTGSVALELLDAITDESRNAEFKNNESKKTFKIPAKQSKGFSWLIDVPYKPGFIKYKAVGATKTNSDGEEGLLPILSSRILVTESLPLPVKGEETKKFKFEKLVQSKSSKTIEQKALTIEMTSNPAWYAVQALPYLIEFPHECSEQTFSRIYANKLAAYIANSDPKIRRVFDIWAKDEQFNKGTALMSNLEKNQHIKSVTLMETPWVLDAENENQQKHQIGVLFQKDRLEREMEVATKKLREMQLSDGSFPWFPGGIGNPFITLYIMTGYGRLRHLGVDIDLLIALKAVDFMDEEIRMYFEKIMEKVDEDNNNNYLDEVHINSTIAFYLYGRSFFLKEKSISKSSKAAVDFFIIQAKKYWLKVPSRMSQAHIALALSRFGDKKTPLDIAKSIKERSVTDDEMGRFWRENEISYSWNRADIETQAMMIELFSEITKDEEAVEECKIWMLKQKQTSCWKTTKSTADAVYALILKGANLLASDKLVKVYLAEKEVKPEKVEAGTGYYQKIYHGGEVKPEMGNVKVVKEDKGIAWGALHWQYIEDMSKVTPFENNLKLKKTLFVKNNTEKGLVISPVKDGKVRVGDLLVVRIELRTDRNLEFVHLKDQRGSGMEPVNVISRYKWQDGLGYYEATKDAASHFYIDYLPKGTYVFEYELRVQLAGQYQTGMAEIMCMYAPEFNSHSESFMLNVEAQ